uniref:Zona pellucida sperm-binding protein 3 n=1 Tax=Sinocyclocheilus rhinocerous TaxID=307959 RepID=A0A673GR35_9TELE
MRLVVFSCVGLLLLIAVDLSLAQWSRFQQGQDPLRFQQQQSPVLAPQQSVQDPQASTTFRPPRPAMRPAGVDARKLQEPGSSQSKQLMQAPMAPLTWHFPVMPEEPQQPDVPFEQRVPIAPQSVAAQCGENFVHVEVKKDFFGIGQLVNPSFLTLGGCAAVGEDPEAEVLIFEYELQTCDSSLMMTDNELVYTFNLLYTSVALVGTPIVRADVAAVGIECHYSRGNDWMFERPSNQYFLGQFLKLEASVKQYNHVPLRIFVDGCVATAAPNVNTTSPRYSFIENHGLVKNRSISLLQAPLPVSCVVFRVTSCSFSWRLSDSSKMIVVYIAPALKAVMASTPTCPENKACSFINGYVYFHLSMYFNFSPCHLFSGLVSEGKATIGPIVITH